MEAISIVAGLNRLRDAIADDDSSVANKMREAIESVRVKVIEQQALDSKWRK